LDGVTSLVNFRFDSGISPQVLKYKVTIMMPSYMKQKETYQERDAREQRERDAFNKTLPLIATKLGDALGTDWAVSVKPNDSSYDTGACKNDREHTMETHLVLVRNACIARAVMEKARYVVARRLYESV
jgi:hypothetical protein